MKNITLAATAAAALSAAVLGLAAPTLAAPTGTNAQDTISQLEAQGNRVVVNRQGNTPLDQASVVSITRGPIMRQAVPNSTPNGDGTRSFSTQTIYVTIK
jgi:aspartate carbamoyltransferase catalytic subunit